MIYTPQKQPKQAMILVTVIALLGAFGGYFRHKFLMVVALLFWMQYTAILSYIQFKKNRRYPMTTFTSALLNPQLRFFLFEFLAIIGLWSIFKYNTMSAGFSALIAWWLFALNFFVYYSRKRKK
ncbi:MAG: hypothetical protein AABX47_09350 [Nanoarchaeota archaeon]